MLPVNNATASMHKRPLCSSVTKCVGLPDCRKDIWRDVQAVVTRCRGCFKFKLKVVDSRIGTVRDTFTAAFKQEWNDFRFHKVTS